MGLGQWLHDTVREVTSGGKAKTKTYNTSSPAQSRPAPAQRPAPIRLPGQSAPSQYVSTPTPRRPLGPQTPVQQSWGTGRPPSFSKPAGPSWATQQALAATKKAQAETAAAREAQAKTEKAARDALKKSQGSSAVVPPSTATTATWRPGMAPPSKEEVAKGLDPTWRPGAPVAQSADSRKRAPQPQRARTAFEQEQLRLQARAEDNTNFGLTANTHELSDQEFSKLTPRQRAAVLFNTGLVRAKSKDDDNDGSEIKSYLNSMGLADRTTDDLTLQRYTDLSAAINDALLKRVDAPVAKDRIENGITIRATPTVQNEDVDTVAQAIADQLRVSGRIPGVVKNPGFGQSKHDSVLQTAYGIMIDSSVNQTSEDIAQGLAQLNQVNGTNVTPQQLWNFTKVQLDAADYGKIANADITLPSPDASITPLSVKDIRARYGL